MYLNYITIHIHMLFLKELEIHILFNEFEKKQKLFINVTRSKNEVNGQYNKTLN